MSIRTDMAAESFSQAGGAEKLQGVKVKNKVIENARFEVTDITIETQEAAEKLAQQLHFRSLELGDEAHRADIDAEDGEAMLGGDL